MSVEWTYNFLLRLKILFTAQFLYKNVVKNSEKSKFSKAIFIWHKFNTTIIGFLLYCKNLYELIELRVKYLDRISNHKIIKIMQWWRPKNINWIANFFFKACYFVWKREILSTDARKWTSLGVIHKPLGQIVGFFDHPQSWFLLLNKANVIKWSFG